MSACPHIHATLSFSSPSFPIWMLCNPLALSITSRNWLIRHSVNHRQLQTESTSSERNTCQGHSFRDRSFSNFGALFGSLYFVLFNLTLDFWSGEKR